MMFSPRSFVERTAPRKGKPRAATGTSRNHALAGVGDAKLSACRIRSGSRTEWPGRQSRCRPIFVVHRQSMWAPLAISTAVHALLLGGLWLGAQLRWPAPPIPIEVRPLHRKTQQVGPLAKRDEPPRAAAQPAR